MGQVATVEMHESLEAAGIKQKKANWLLFHDMQQAIHTRGAGPETNLSIYSIVSTYEPTHCREKKLAIFSSISADSSVSSEAFHSLN